MWSYFGGKYFQAPWIEQFIPEDMKTYVEPFGGAFWVYLKSNMGSFMAYPNLENVVYNDLNKNNVNLWRCLNSDIGKMHNIVKNMQFEAGAEDTFRRFQDDLGVECGNEESELINQFDLSDKPDFARAIKYIFLVTHTWSGLSLNRSRHEIPKGKETQWWSFQRKLNNNDYVRKANRITDIENLDYKDLIDKYDNENTFFYLDPPYFKVAVYTIDSFESIHEHEKLAKKLKEIKGRWLLSYYYFPELEDWFPKNEYKWEKKFYSKVGGKNVRGTKKNKAEEILIMNY